MRLTGAQVEDLLKEIIAEDSEYQKLLINDRIIANRDSNPDLLERLIEKAWDELFGYDTDRLISMRMDFDHLAFRSVGERVLSLTKAGADVKTLVQRLGLKQKVFDAPEIPDLITETGIDKDAYNAWQNVRIPFNHKLNYIIVVQKLLEIYAERYLNPQAYPPPKDMIGKDKSVVAVYIFCEGIPKIAPYNARPDDWKSKLNKEQFNIKGPLESRASVRWEYLDKMFGGKDIIGKRLFDAYCKIQTAFDNDNDMSEFIEVAEQLPLTMKGKIKLREMKEITDKK